MCCTCEYDRGAKWKKPRPAMVVKPCERKVHLIYNFVTLIVVKCILQMADFYYYNEANDAHDNSKI